MTASAPPASIPLLLPQHPGAPISASVIPVETGIARSPVLVRLVGIFLFSFRRLTGAPVPGSFPSSSSPPPRPARVDVSTWPWPCRPDNV